MKAKTETNTDVNQVNQGAETLNLNLNFDVVVYREMADQTSETVNVLKMIENQFAQLQYLNAKKKFLNKELKAILKA